MKDSDWLAGFADGEGCFWISRSRSNKHKKQPGQFRIFFEIALRQDDVAVLYRLRDTFGGAISEYRITSGDNAKPAAQWQVAARKDILELIQYFDAHPLLSKKRRDYLI